MSGITCPICGGNSNCGNVAGKPHGECWCDKSVFPPEIFEKVPSNGLENHVFDKVAWRSLRTRKNTVK